MNTISLRSVKPTVIPLVIVPSTTPYAATTFALWITSPKFDSLGIRPSEAMFCEAPFASAALARRESHRIQLESRSAVLLNHVGFKRSGVKHFLVEAAPSASLTAFELLSALNETVFTGPLTYAGSTAEWSIAPNVWTGDFTTFEGTGIGFRIRIRVGTSESVVGAADNTDKVVTTTTTRYIVSERFDIGDALLAELCVPDLWHYLRSQRVSGKYAKKDAAVLFAAAEDGSRREGVVDLRGGWFDASGDTSKYLSHLSYANFMNPQQTPLVTWSLLESAAFLELNGGSDRRTSFIVPLREEALYGCDFLVRMQDADGYFYQTLFDKWSKDVNQREICEYATQKGFKYTTWQAGYRQGAGLAIASLAKASALPPSFTDTTSEYTSQVYLTAAERGFAHLEAHNTSYLNDGTENIIDHYCALLAATELFAATNKTEYLDAARVRAEKLMACQASNATLSNFWMANGRQPDDPLMRPFFHASDAGLPVIALCRYAETETDAAAIERVKASVQRAMEFEVTISREVNNPFLYPRQYTKAVGGVSKTAFFFPHENESGYWWQGENARLGSLSVAASKALLLLSPPAESTFKQDLEVFKTSAIDWVLGKNPFDMCMLQGRGRRNPEYLPQYPNAPGGICNGITGGFDNENDLCFKPDPHGGDMAQNWRWGEQWIPHGAWFLLAAVLH
ncbi:cellulase [Chytriomyces confervae]|uniref:cellulase n=1 Tax=Chytriomyces confervae TaxID=246404 RepID=A0A507FLZ1_9FUNG|nr:cellulase [Chytriomyces confervae]